jgi:hypothetical protein
MAVDTKIDRMARQKTCLKVLKDVSLKRKEAAI